MKTKIALATLAAVVGLAATAPASLATPSAPAAEVGLYIGAKVSRGMKTKARIKVVVATTIIGSMIGIVALPRQPAVGAFVGAL